MDENDRLSTGGEKEITLWKENRRRDVSLHFLASSTEFASIERSPTFAHVPPPFSLFLYRNFWRPFIFEELQSSAFASWETGTQVQHNISTNISCDSKSGILQ